MRKSAGNGAQSTESNAQSKSESSTNRYAFRSNTETNTSRAVTSLAMNRRIIRTATGRPKPGRKKSAYSIDEAALESPSQNPRAVHEPERDAILAIDTVADAFKRTLKTSLFGINTVPTTGSEVNAARSDRSARCKETLVAANCQGEEKATQGRALDGLSFSCFCIVVSQHPY